MTKIHISIQRLLISVWLLWNTLSTFQQRQLISDLMPSFTAKQENTCVLKGLNYRFHINIYLGTLA